MPKKACYSAGKHVYATVMQDYHLLSFFSPFTSNVPECIFDNCFGARPAYIMRGGGTVSQTMKADGAYDIDSSFSLQSLCSMGL